MRSSISLSPRLSSFLDLARWVSALSVVVLHVRHLVFLDYKAAQPDSLFYKAFYFLTGFGHEGVMVFFVMSGFLVGGLSIGFWQERGFDAKRYVLQRFSRIYIVLIPVLVVGALLDFFGSTFLDASFLYTNPFPYDTGSLFGDMASHLSLQTFGWNLAMFGNAGKPFLGTNSPLWSLSYEWWYYVMFLLFSCAFVWRQKKKGVLCGWIAVGVALYLPWALVSYGLIWLLGTGAYLYGRSNFPRPSAWIGGLAFFASLAFSRFATHQINWGSNDMGEFFRDFIVGGGFALWIVTLFNSNKASLPFSALHKSLADFSYSLYLSHFPALVFVVALLFKGFGLPFQIMPSFKGLFYFASLALGLYIYGFLFSLLTERQTPKVRRWLTAHFFF